MNAFRRAIYVAMLTLVGGAAFLHLVFTPIAMAAPLLGLQPLWNVCPVPVVCDFDDPTHRIIERLLPMHHFSPGAETRVNFGLYYLRGAGPLLTAALVAFLAVRRLLAFRRIRAPDPPASFAGFAFGLALFGFAVYAYGKSGHSGGIVIGLKDSWENGIMIVFVAFLVSELASFVGERGQRVAADSAPRRRPVWSVLAIVFPLLGVLAAAALWILSGGGRDGFAAMAILSGGAVMVLAGLGLGAAATLIAVIRRERWAPLQVVGFVLGFGIGLPSLLQLLR